MGADVTTEFGLKINKITGRGGAEVSGIKLGPDLQPATVKAIRDLLLEHKVIFFRDQHHLDDQSQEAFAKLLGEPVAHPTVPSVENTKMRSGWIAITAAVPIPGTRTSLSSMPIRRRRFCGPLPFHKLAATPSGQIPKQRMSISPRS